MKEKVTKKMYCYNVTSCKHHAKVDLHCYKPFEHSKAGNKVSLENHQQNNQEAVPMHILSCDLRMTWKKWNWYLR